MREYFCHMAMTYENTALLLKGFYLTLCHNIPFRDVKGCQLSEQGYINHLHGLMEREELDKSELGKLMNPTSYVDITIFVGGI